MNRKQIVNEQLGWPEISDADSKKITDCIENNLKKFSGLRRKKTLPKSLRKKKKEQEAKQPPEENKNQILDLDTYVKKHLRIGINSITKCLEKEPENVLLVIVCKSCKPVTVLTRHIQVMCSMSNIPAGCVNNLSSNLSKLFNVKTVSALAVCKDQKSENVEESSVKIVKDMLSGLYGIIVPLLPEIKNPFVSNESLNPPLNIEHVNNELNNVTLSKKDNLPVRLKSNSNENEKFGADFISINKTKKNFASFDDNKFILFSENEQSDQELDEEMQSENNDFL